MARIVLGLGSSHTPMLLVDAADLPRYEENDRRLALLDTEGAPVAFDALLAAASAQHADDVTAEGLSARHEAARQAIGALADAIASASLDTLIVIGDDQKEMFRGDDVPPLLIHGGATIRSERLPHPPSRPDWVLRGSDRYYPADGPREYPVAQALARHLSAHLATEGFAVAATAFPGDGRVGVVASGGLSPFRGIDERLDRAVVRALAERDHATLAALPVEKLNSGSAEIRNWICAAGALGSLRLDWIEYLAGYRTKAGYRDRFVLRRVAMTAHPRDAPDTCHRRSPAASSCALGRCGPGPALQPDWAALPSMQFAPSEPAVSRAARLGRPQSVAFAGAAAQQQKKQLP